MMQDARWVGRFTHKKTGEMICVRVEDTSTLPGPQSRGQIIADPFADPLGDAVAQTLEAQVQGEQTLEALQQDYDPALPLRPGKIIGIGRNFADHAKELNNEVPAQPLLFFKPSSALLLDGQPLKLPRDVGRIDMEAELCVVIGKGGRCIEAQQAQEHVGALVMGNDISARELQKSQPRWVRAKGADGFAPLGQWLRVARELPPADLRVQGCLDDKMVQDAPISHYVFDIPTLLADISRVMTLEAGDLIFTGTPAGVSALAPGMRTKVQAQGLCLAGVSTPLI